MEILFLHENVLHGKILPRNPIPQPPTQKKSPENVCILTNNQYYMQTMGKVHNLQPLLRGLWGIKLSSKTWLWSPLGKQKTNKHASMIFLLAKNTKFHIFTDRSWKPLCRVLWYAEFDGVIFIKIFYF